MAAYYKDNTARAIDPAPAVRHKTAVKKRPVMFVYRNDHKHKLATLTIITLVMIFAGAAGTAVSFANVSIDKQNINALKADLREKQLIIKNMTEEVNRCVDAGEIMEAARGMGMSKPKPYQILHIDVPDVDHVEFN